MKQTKDDNNNHLVASAALGPISLSHVHAFQLLSLNRSPPFSAEVIHDLCRTWTWLIFKLLSGTIKAVLT